jgi:hypothetical protein
VTKIVRIFTSVCVNTMQHNCTCGSVCEARLHVNAVYFDVNQVSVSAAGLS